MHRRAAMRQWVGAIRGGRLAQRQLCLTRYLVLILLVGCGVLPTLAFASPPDPVWIPGIHDLADYH